MGGLFSKPEPASPPESITYPEASSSEPISPPKSPLSLSPEGRRSVDERLTHRFSGWSIKDGRQFRDVVINNVENKMYNCGTNPAQTKPKQVQMKWSQPNLTFERASDEDLTFITSLISNENIVIDSAKQICNPYLANSYALKKRQKEFIYRNLQEKWLFHGTKKINCRSICEYNFDWRRRGDSVGHIFGQGISFSCNAVYASHYSDKCISKIFIIAKVLIGNTCNGNEYMVIPDSGTDTALKNDTFAVAVKFEDAEYLPFYLVEYHYKPGFIPNHGQHKKRSINNEFFEEW